MTKKLSAVLILVLITVFTLGLCLCLSQPCYAASAEGSSVVANAENQPTEDEGNSGEQSTEPTTQGVSESVKQYLLSVYGEEWETYYNKIIEKWGSIEKYLLNASENLPEQYKYKTQDLILSVGGYVPLAANIILIIVGIGYVIYSRVKNKRINDDLNSIKKEQDQEIMADLAIMDGMKAVFAVLKDLTPGEQFDSARKALEDAEGAIDKVSEDIKQ